MTLLEFIETYKAGSIVSIIVIILSLIEITPIKVSPLHWIGNRLNGDMYKRMDAMEKKLDLHVAQSYRNKILQFQNELLRAGCEQFTQEEYNEVLDAVTIYEQYCRDNNIQNDKCKMAIDYIKRCYVKCQNDASFANLPVQPK